MINKINAIAKKGFTLTELLVVVVMLGILASIAAPSYFKHLEKAKAKEAIDIAKEYQVALQVYLAENSEKDTQSSLSEEDLGMDYLEKATAVQGGYLFSSKMKNFVANRSAGTLRLHNLSNNYDIVAQKDNIYCCWNQAESDMDLRGKIICEGVTSNRDIKTVNITEYNFSLNFKCYII